MDCSDWIAMQLAQSTAKPLELLAEHAALTAVTVRVRAGDRRFDVTVTKHWPAGRRGAPAFAWRVDDAPGDERAATPPGAPTYASAEEAYWSAVEALDAAAAGASSPAPSGGSAAR